MPSSSPEDLFSQFRQTLSDCRDLFRESAQLYTESQPEDKGKSPAEFEQLMHDLERGLILKVFIEIAQSDWNWSAPEYTLAGELFEHLWGKRLEPAPLRRALKKIVEQSGSLRWSSLVRPFASCPPLRDQVGRLQTVVMRLANIVAKIDDKISPEEAQRLKSIQLELDTHLVPIPVEGGALAPQPTMVAVDRAVAPEKPEVGNIRRQAAPTDEGARRNQLDEAMQELAGLIGLKSIKDDIRELVNFLKIQSERTRLGLPRTTVALHMVFGGNPGTGKTTVARMLGKIFGGLGVLKKGHLVETDRSGLVAKYAGQTAPKTHKQLDEALDGVLFIDEAYSLVAEKGDDAYGNEALQVLLKRAEDDRERLVVVLAGYPGPMQELLSSNPGLSSRFNRHLDFPDYSAGELGQIFQVMCDKNHYVLPAPTRLKLLLGFQYLLDHRDEAFGNGRLARNTFEISIRRLANRIATIAPLTAELLTTLEPADIFFSDVPREVFENLEGAAHRMTIECPGCGHEARFRPDKLGFRVKCRRCEHEFQLDWGELAEAGD